jgi:hypothetical protein
MSIVARLAAFVAVLVLCFGAAYAVGAAVGPVDDSPGTSTTTVSHDTDAEMDMEAGG